MMKRFLTLMMALGCKISNSVAKHKKKSRKSGGFSALLSSMKTSCVKYGNIVAE